MSFHHNGAYLIDALRNTDENNQGATSFSNPFPFYNYGQANRETFEFECNFDEEEEELETIYVNPDNFKDDSTILRQQSSIPKSGDETQQGSQSINTGCTQLSQPRLQMLQLEPVTEEEKLGSIQTYFNTFKYAEEGGLLQLLDNYDRACLEIERELLRPQILYQNSKRDEDQG